MKEKSRTGVLRRTRSGEGGTEKPSWEKKNLQKKWAGREVGTSLYSKKRMKKIRRRLRIKKFKSLQPGIRLRHAKPQRSEKGEAASADEKK